MTLSNNNYYGNKRRKGPPITRRVVGWTFAMILILGAGWYAYRTGSSLAAREAGDLREEIVRVQDQLQSLEQQNAGLQRALEEQRVRGDDLGAQLARLAPTPEARKLLDLVRARVDAGVNADRLSEVITAIGPQWKCTGDPVTKRFLLNTPIMNNEANGAVTFANNAITVTGTGVSMVGENRQPVAVFDPGQPVTITFARLGGQSNQVSGKLPIHGSVQADNNTIYRFTVVEGDRAFVSVTGQPCAFP